MVRYSVATGRTSGGQKTQRISRFGRNRKRIIAMKKEYLVSALEMKQLDYNTIKKTGLPSLVLMERAALAVAQSVMDYLNGNNKKRILVIAGNGNNGADGVCAGRILKEYGYDVEICVLKSKHEYTEEMKVQLDAATKYDIKWRSYKRYRYCYG